MDALDDHIFQEDDHRTAFTFTPSSASDPSSTSPSTSRPAKRRRVSSKKTDFTPQDAQSHSQGPLSTFTPLLSSRESPLCINLRASLFQTTWPLLESRIAEVLRSSNATTLEEVTSFLSSFASSASTAPNQEGCDQQPAISAAREKIPAGFIITGPNIAGQELLFEQLGEELAKGGARVVRIRSGEGVNLKAVLKKIVKDAGSFDAEDGDGEGQVGRKGGRKYLDYDLEALHEVVKGRRVVVAFQDSEGFDNALLADLVRLFWEWRGRIGFEVLFGIATSVELFQARLLKSTARLMVGRQFDVVQADKVLESVFRSAVVGGRARVRVGGGLLRGWVDRQGGEVVGVGGFVSSLKYAYMCHFYANPLSLLLAEAGELGWEALQPEHLEAVRTLESFRTHVEAAVEARQLRHAQMLLDDDEYLAKWILEQGPRREEYLQQLLRSLHLLLAVGLHTTPFTELYISALSDGIDLSADSQVLEKAKQLGPGELVALVERLLDAIRDGSAELDLAGWEDDAEELTKPLTEIRDDIEALAERAKADRNPLKSKYSAQSRVVRTTVVAQKVQLSHDTATLTEDDKAFTAAIDKLAEVLIRHIQSEPVTSCPLHEAWLYDAKSPYRDVFVPRPGVTFARALSRPHDYLSCACCKPNNSLSGTLPTTSVLCHLYLEAGALINVADLWSAYLALVGEDTDIGMDERTALVQFYRGLGELRAMGFVKQSKKKADHIAKLKWL
ncbi:origin recognition complex subunit 3 N-terminus-domain-containing protein [Immersiella caudata]|uniref:Origin recognition complex subunit 3 N-terminus-domain-containing protein n=1 Tax=Immersiella caudata TaxID=314043 RepID=A0AA39XG95_9PEZI|nr:origin recognition complex subunit 3 N-terminus-domain-containing protein [Immersiella caudata]